MASLSNLLVPHFPAKHIHAALGHFETSVNHILRGDWENGIAKAGKFSEAVLKAVATHTSTTFATGRKFKADAVIAALGQLPHGSHDDTLRLLIPRAIRVIYDIASNRGARHDPDEINPNGMDANVVLPLSSWILAEMIRYAQKGVVDPSEARDLVEALVEKKYPAIEAIDGRVYLHAKKKSAVDVGLVILAQRHPKRVNKEELAEGIKRNGFTLANSKVAVGRMAKFTDDNGNGEMRLLATGLKKAEEIISAAVAMPAPP